MRIRTDPALLLTPDLLRRVQYHRPFPNAIPLMGQQQPAAPYAPYIASPHDIAVMLSQFVTNLPGLGAILQTPVNFPITDPRGASREMESAWMENDGSRHC